MLKLKHKTKNNLPTTLSLSSICKKQKTKNNNSVINESNKIKTLIFLYTLSLPIFWKVFNGKCLWTYEIKIPKGLVATRDVVIHMSYFIANYKGGRNESFMYGYNKIKS